MNMRLVPVSRTQAFRMRRVTFAAMRFLALLLILFTASARAGDGPLMSAHMMLPVEISGNKVS